VAVQVPSHIQRGADVAVDIARKHVRVAYRDHDGKMVDVVNGELTWEVHKEESLWSLVPGEHVHVSLICALLYFVQQQQPKTTFYGHYTVQPALASTSS